MLYYRAKEEGGLWLFENQNDWKYANKTESVFTTANGYFGIRATHDFKYVDREPGLFVAGFFQKAGENEVTELINCPDVTEMEFVIDDDEVGFSNCIVEEYERKYNVKTGELVISGVWTTQSGIRLQICSKRFAAMSDRHVWRQKLEFELLNRDACNVRIRSGINGQITNSGVSHFRNTECRVYDKEIMHYKGNTDDATLDIYAKIQLWHSSDRVLTKDYLLKRRSIYEDNRFVLRRGQRVAVDKLVYIVKDADDHMDNATRVNKIRNLHETYEVWHNRHELETEKFWRYADIHIDGISLEERAAICYSQYQLYSMTPYHTDKVSIAAKGLTGEGYKGHVFWDTEIYMLPFYYYTYPDIAKNLLIYRYHGLAGARKKAQEYGYEGAMYPWESAADGKEETPEYAALNIHTGRANKVWSGIKEHHISADIAYAIIQYYKITCDEDFMEMYGLEMLVEICKFWCSRVTPQNGRLEILDIIGPDEYNEHIDNNAYTNYLVSYITKETIHVIEQMKEKNSKKYDELNHSIGIDKNMDRFYDLANHIYLPQPDENGIIPQDDSFMKKPQIENIEKYKNSQIKQAVLLDYSRDEVVDMQVLKQADTVMLLNLFPTLLSADLIKKNVLFYESRTLHDSSLSYCSHAQACANIGEVGMSIDFFKKALETDLCDNPYDSRDGLHAASLGGIWNCIVEGYAGLAVSDKGLELIPHLPAEWKGISFYFMVRGNYHKIDISHDGVTIVSQGKMQDGIQLKIFEKEYIYKDHIFVNY